MIYYGMKVVIIMVSENLYMNKIINTMSTPITMFMHAQYIIMTLYACSIHVCMHVS